MYVLVIVLIIIILILIFVIAIIIMIIIISATSSQAKVYHRHHLGFLPHVWPYSLLPRKGKTSRNLHQHICLNVARME